MKNIKSKVVQIIVLIVFIIIMNTGGLLKKPFSKNDNVMECVQYLKEDIEKEDWEKSLNDLNKLEMAWEKVGKRVQFSVERNEMIEMDNNIARLEGAIWGKDKSASYIEISEFVEHWMNLEK